MFERPSTAAVRERKAAGSLARVVGERKVAPLGSRKVPKDVRNARATFAEDPASRTSIRLAETEVTRSEFLRANARTERTVAARGAKRALNLRVPMAPAWPAAWRASSASSPERGASAIVTEMERALNAPAGVAPVALTGAVPGTAAVAIGAATAPATSTAGTTSRFLLRMQLSFE